MPTKEGIEATCPECRGPLRILKTDELVEISCLVGHAYSPRGLLLAHSETQEKALWAAVVALRETSEIVNRLAGEFPPEVAEKLRRQMEAKLSQAMIVEEVIHKLEPFDV
jgi:two-component system, chemotaxis family, protein-glutamate methylesterase/glutaminase